MQIDPAVLIAFMGAILGLLGLILRAFVNGDLLSKNVVSRQAYDRVVQINEGYAVKFSEQTEAVRALAASVDALAKARPAGRR